MLSLAIIAILLVFVTQYFQRTQQNQQVTSALGAFQGVYAAASSAMLDGYSYSGISDLVSGGYLPGSYNISPGGANPFGGTITLTPPLTVKMDSIPGGSVCERIVQKLYEGLSGSQTVTPPGGSATSGSSSTMPTCTSGGTVIVDYSGGTSSSDNSGT
jgi:type II secretory pathway pseudopilin PulG